MRGFTVLLLVSWGVRALCLPIIWRQLLDPLTKRGKGAEFGVAWKVLPFLCAEWQWFVLVLVSHTNIWKKLSVVPCKKADQAYSVPQSLVRE